MKLKEKYRLSAAAVDEVVELVQLVCNDITTKSIAAIVNSGEMNGMDVTSHFFNELPDVMDDVSCPLDMLKTAYKQQAYTTKNLPYVVSNNYCKHTHTIHSVLKYL